MMFYNLVMFTKTDHYMMVPKVIFVAQVFFGHHFYLRCQVSFIPRTSTIKITIMITILASAVMHDIILFIISTRCGVL